MPSRRVVDAEWAPDGSRVAYLDEGGRLISVRYDGTDAIVVATGLNGSSHPTWLNGGSFLVYALNGDLYKVPSLGGSAPVKLSAGHQAGDHDSAPQGGSNGALVFQRVTNGVSWVWTYNGYNNTVNKIANTGNGTQPSISPDGKKIAYIHEDLNTIPQVFVVGVDGSNPTQITFDEKPLQKTDTPVWSADGSQIAFAASGAVVTITPTPHSAENTVTTLVGRISWQANGDATKPISANNPVNLVERLDGADRMETAIQISRWSWDDAAS
ncbi:MAG: PD40 domain-containing protein, partial [Catenulisporales bacterium]|nr:PD40 domain-containing protein [Catenulisporales bacterium]